MRFQHTICITAALAIFGMGCGSQGASRDHDSGKTITESSADANFSTAQAPISGAIFTTNSDGSQVNGNIYAAKTDVYLNGGPARPGAAGLPDGDYYYLITDPGCKEQLAGPSAAAPNNTLLKVITVENGEFTELIQLAPFADTPNNGGEYKVHVTPVADYDPTAQNSCFGFVSRFSKTDNFKVRPQGAHCISGEKFFDKDYDGVRDPEDTQTIPGFKIILTYPDNSTDFTYTGTNGEYSFCILEDGTYGVDEELPPPVNSTTWLQTFPLSGGYEVTVDGADVTGIDFGNSCMDHYGWKATPCEVPAY